METLGECLKDARRKNGLSLRRAQGKSGVSYPYISLLENGKISKPSPLILKKLADAYDVSYARLIQLAGYPVETADKGQGEVVEFFKKSAAFLEGGTGRKAVAFIVAAIAIMAGAIVYSQHLFSQNSTSTPPLMKTPGGIPAAGALNVEIADPQFSVTTLSGINDTWAPYLFTSHSYTNTSLTILMNGSWEFNRLGFGDPVAYLYNITNTLPYSVTLNFTVGNLPVWTAFSYFVAESANYSANVVETPWGPLASVNPYYSYVLTYRYTGNGTYFNILWKGSEIAFQSGSYSQGSHNSSNTTWNWTSYAPDITGASFMGGTNMYGTLILGNGSVIVPANGSIRVWLHALNMAYVPISPYSEGWVTVQTWGISDSTPALDSSIIGSAVVSI